MIDPAPSTDVLIAGGSFAGLALAAALAHESGGDLSITVVSPSFPPLDQSAVGIRASALSRGSLHLLDHLGLWTTLAPDAQPVSAIELTDSSLDDAVRPTRLRYDLGDVTSDASLSADVPKMVIVENHYLGAALHNAARIAKRVSLFDNVSIINFTPDADHVAARLSNGQTLTARLLVAADGSRSRLRAHANIRTLEQPYNQTGIIAMVEPELPHEGRAIQHFLPAGPFALLPMTGNRMCITWTESSGEAQRVLALNALAFRAEVEKRFGHYLGTLRTISPPHAWPLHLCIARTLIAPRFALIGDAAHTVHPIAGQGLNLGLRDVAALTECIIDTARLGLDIGQMTPLRRYERWRRFDNFASAAGFDALNRLFATTSTLARSARGAALGIADNLPGLKSWLIEEAGGDHGDRPRLLR